MRKKPAGRKGNFYFIGYLLHIFRIPYMMKAKFSNEIEKEGEHRMDGGKRKKKITDAAAFQAPVKDFSELDRMRLIGEALLLEFLMAEFFRETHEPKKIHFRCK